MGSRSLRLLAILVWCCLFKTAARAQQSATHPQEAAANAASDASSQLIVPNQAIAYSVVRLYPSLVRLTVLKIPITPQRVVRGVTRGGEATTTAPENPSDWVVTETRSVKTRGGAVESTPRLQDTVRAVDLTSQPGYALLFLDREQLLQSGSGPRTVTVGIRQTRAANEGTVLRGATPVGGAPSTPATQAAGQSQAAQAGGGKNQGNSAPTHMPGTVSTQGIKSGSGEEIPVGGLFENLDLAVAPQQLSTVKLLNGQKTGVVQVGVDLEAPDLKVLQSGNSRSYIHSSNLLSSAPLDPNTGLGLIAGHAIRLGRARTLTAPTDPNQSGNPAAGPTSQVIGAGGASSKQSSGKPEDTDAQLRTELGILGNQTAENQSAIAAVGICNPWGTGWLKAHGLKDFADAPTTLLRFDAGYVNRLRIDRDIVGADVTRNSFQVTGVFSTAFILFPGAAARETDSAKRADMYSRKLAIQVVAKGWILPYDRFTGPVQSHPLLGRIELSLLVPLNSKVFGYSSNGDPQVRLRFKVINGPDDASNFAIASHYFTIGIESNQLWSK